jgi:hypothetical protein
MSNKYFQPHHVKNFQWSYFNILRWLLTQSLTVWREIWGSDFKEKIRFFLKKIRLSVTFVLPWTKRSMSLISCYIFLRQKDLGTKWFLISATFSTSGNLPNISNNCLTKYMYWLTEVNITFSAMFSQPLNNIS